MSSLKMASPTALSGRQEEGVGQATHSRQVLGGRHNAGLQLRLYQLPGDHPRAQLQQEAPAGQATGP